MNDDHFDCWYSDRDGFRFKSENHHIWKIKEGWMVATHGEEGFCLHKKYIKLEDALKELLKKTRR